MRQLLFIPCKPFGEAKTRLRDVLDPDRRAALARELYRHTLAAVNASDGGFEAIVVSSDTEAIAMARRCGLGTITERCARGLNAALRTATGSFSHRDGLRFAYLPTDLPELTAAHLNELAGLAQGDEVHCAIAPDTGWLGTNFLSWPAHIDLRMSFGPDSFNAHCLQARQHDLQVHLVMADALRRDLDLPRDLPRFNELRSHLEPADAHASDGTSVKRAP